MSCESTDASSHGGCTDSSVTLELTSQPETHACLITVQNQTLPVSVYRSQGSQAVLTNVFSVQSEQFGMNQGVG